MKGKTFAFNKTIRGYRHIQENLPCQDSSASYSSDGGDYRIICVADGHGDPACHRSDIGSKIAAEVALKSLTEFANALISGDMSFAYSRQQSECLEQLTNTIASKWHGAVRNDLLSNDVSDEDFANAGMYEDAYRKGERLEHLYGTTLIAGLYVSDYLILIQQGDGRCDVFFSDGSVCQPIPWDERCKGSTTTSMCDKDVFFSIRTAVIDLSEQDVVACFIGTDGVEDSYFDNEESQSGTHRFYMEQCCKLSELGDKEYAQYLEEMLPGFSKGGSSDDVSIAGIVDLDGVAPLVGMFKGKVETYDKRARLHIDYEEARSKLISMSRKHGILKARLDEINSKLESAKQELRTVVAELNKNDVKSKQLAEQIKTAEEDLEHFRSQSELTANGVAPVEYPTIIVMCQQLITRISGEDYRKERIIRGYKGELKRLNDEIKKLDVRRMQLIEKVDELSNKVADDQKAFDEYDERYRQIESEIEGIKAEIQALNGEGL